MARHLHPDQIVPTNNVENLLLAVWEELVAIREGQAPTHTAVSEPAPAAEKAPPKKPAAKRKPAARKKPA